MSGSLLNITRRVENCFAFSRSVFVPLLLCSGDGGGGGFKSGTEEELALHTRGEKDCWVVFQTLTYAGEVLDNWNAVLSEVVLGADARKHKDFRHVESAGAENYFMLCKCWFSNVSNERP